jgi:sodium-dependent phosphate cotransporter
MMLAILLYGFFLGLDLMGLAFKLFGKGFAEALIARTANPFVGLFIGILATTLVQSSSTTTSMTVALVAAGGLTIEGAIPIIMGANIGTSVTNTLVSLAHVTRREEFQRAFAGATVHDFFNWMAVLVFLPVEIATGYLARTSSFLADALDGMGGTKLFNPLRAIVRPAAEQIEELLGDSGGLVLALGILLLIVCLKLLVDLLKVVMTGRAEAVLHRTLFRSAMAAVLAGVAMTVMVQSSSITTSVMVPLVGAGIITLEQVFPYTIGANIGTTVTAMLAALSTGSPASVTVAFSHLIFNLSASAVVYLPPPIRAIPLALARALGRVGSRNRLLAAVYIAVFFFGLPLLLLLVTGTL